jgi:hypothetical protein
MASCSCGSVAVSVVVAAPVAVSNEDLAKQLVNQKAIEQSALTSITVASASLSAAQIEIKKIKDELKLRYDTALAAESLAKLSLETAKNNLAELTMFSSL